MIQISIAINKFTKISINQNFNNFNKLKFQYVINRQKIIKTKY